MNNIQTGGGRDNSVGDDKLILQLVIASSVGEFTFTVSFLTLRIYSFFLDWADNLPYFRGVNPFILLIIFSI